LARENAKIKQELESANAQINSLKEKISTIKIVDNNNEDDNHKNKNNNKNNNNNHFT
jgi:hypothetical protein